MEASTTKSSRANGKEERRRSSRSDSSSRHRRETDRDHSSKRKRSRSPEERRRSSDDKKRKKHKKEKHRKKEKKEKHKSDRHKQLEEEAKLFLQQNAASSQTLISDKDYFAKNPEFRQWLIEAKNKFFDELSSHKAHKYFDKFVTEWNKGQLPEKYYTGRLQTDTESNTRTRYVWGFTKKNTYNPVEVEAVKDQVSKETNVGRGARPSSTSRLSSSTSSTSQPSALSSSTTTNDGIDDEDERRYNRLMKRKQDKNFNDYKRAVMDELAPKPDPGSFAAKREKRMAKGAYTRKDDSPEHDEVDLMGGDDSLRARLYRQRERETARKEAKAQQTRSKLEEYQRKEDEKMAMFREMLKNRPSGALGAP